MRRLSPRCFRILRLADISVISELLDRSAHFWFRLLSHSEISAPEPNTIDSRSKYEFDRAE